MLVLLAYLGGVLSILSPCILPVVPFVLSRGEQPFVRSGLPLLLGMAITFAGVACLAVSGGWVVEVSQYGRFAALAALAVAGVALVSERAAVLLAKPAVAVGQRLLRSADALRVRWVIAASVLLGAATGLLWAPCAGPILGLVLTTASLKGGNGESMILLLAYAGGAATSLAVVLLAGKRVLGALTFSRSAEPWMRRGLGVAVLASVAAIASGVDLDLLSNVSSLDTAPMEQTLIQKLAPASGRRGVRPRAEARQSNANDEQATLMPVAFSGSIEPGSLDGLRSAAADEPATEGRLPSLSGATEWINSAPLSAQALRGRVVLVNVWTYACINCRHVLPHVKAWAQKYRDAGLVVIGVHTPELAFERLTSNVRQAVRNYGIDYPVAVDTNSVIWNSFDNEYWPSNYLADARGRLRYHHAGEGDYRRQEEIIQQLLREAGADSVPGGFVSVDAKFATAAAAEVEQ